MRRGQTDADGQPRLSPGERLRVLLVCADDADARQVGDLLADAPVTVDRVASVGDAVTGQAPADCVLLDLPGSGSDGLVGLTRLRYHAPGAAVVVLAQRRDEQTGAAAVASGAQDYLVKDQVDGPLLVKALRYAWERKRAEEAEQLLLQQQLLASESNRMERGLLPAPLLAGDGLGLATRYRPGRHGPLLGGDFYDAVELPDGTVALVIGDVSGHGPDEAALGVALRIAWRSLVLAGLPMAEVLATAQRVLVHERVRRLYVTLCMIVVGPDRGSLRMVLAGHPPPLLIDAGGSVRQLPDDRRGVPLGVLADASWESLEVPLEPGWSLLLYTDGLLEGRVDGTPERLGRDNMIGLALDIVRAKPGWRDDPGVVLDELISSVERLNGGRLDDDIAMMLLSHAG